MFFFQVTSCWSSLSIYNLIQVGWLAWLLQIVKLSLPCVGIVVQHWKECGILVGASQLTSLVAAVARVVFAVGLEALAHEEGLDLLGVAVLLVVDAELLRVELVLFRFAHGSFVRLVQWGHWRHRRHCWALNLGRLGLLAFLNSLLRLVGNNNHC